MNFAKKKMKYMVATEIFVGLLHSPFAKLLKIKLIQDGFNQFLNIPFN